MNRRGIGRGRSLRGCTPEDPDSQRDLKGSIVNRRFKLRHSTTLFIRHRHLSKSNLPRDPRRTLREGARTLVEIPEWTLIVAVAAWAVTQIFTIWGAKWVIGKAKTESQAQKNEVVTHFDEALGQLETKTTAVNIEGLEARVQAIDEALGAKFEELDGVLDALPARMLQAAGSVKGVEMKALYKDAVEGEEELEEYMAETTDPAVIAMARIEAIEPSKEWGEAHPLGKMLVEAGKEFFKAKMDEARGVVTMKRVGGEKKSPYGY